MIQYSQDLCRDLDRAARIEWLETNGLGGYASSSICGMNTRRYHGLLVAATKPPVGRLVLLSKLEETLTVGAKRYDLSTNQYPGVVHPAGYLHLKQFRLDPFPVFLYEIDGLLLEKSLYLAQGENTVVIRYRLLTPAANCMLELRPLLAFRDYHSLMRENSALQPSFERENGRLRLTPYPDLPSLYLAHPAGDVRETGCWYRNFEYERERERGFDFHEDLFNPCALVARLTAQAPLSIVASTEPNAAAPPEPGPRSAADQFLVRRGERHSVIAGYHWFTDWGRDTMISLPGLTLSTGRPEIARSILLEYAASVDRGMLPNRFPDSGEQPEYNTVDATLWFFEAVRAYLAHTGDLEFVRASLYPVLADIAAWHERGTCFGIRVDADGLLAAGEPGMPLTWMDARVDGRAITPRIGKAVEIQALWYNALRILEELAPAAEKAHYHVLAERAAASFRAQFWNSETGCLYDVIDSDYRDPAIRPNQIFAVSLPNRMLPPEQERAIVDAVAHSLLTPYGLRTLAPGDPQYRGRYEGDARARDSAYHQGTVWPWLMGPFVEAYRKTHGDSPETRRQTAEWLAPLREYMESRGAGQLPEIFDGDAPHRPAGCIAQAWSVAEFLRTLSDLA